MLLVIQEARMSLLPFPSIPENIVLAYGNLRINTPTICLIAK